MWWILHSGFATHVVRSTILDNGIVALLLDLGAVSNRHLDITYRPRWIEVAGACNSARCFTYVCEHCKLFPAEDILWWVSTHHGQRRKKNSMAFWWCGACWQPYDWMKSNQLADDRTDGFFCIRSARWRVGHHDQCVEIGHELQGCQAQDPVWSRSVSRSFHVVDTCRLVVHLAGCRCFSLSVPHRLPTCLRKHVFACDRNSSVAHSGIRCRFDPTCVSHASMQSNGCVVLGLFAAQTHCRGFSLQQLRSVCSRGSAVFSGSTRKKSGTFSTATLRGERARRVRSHQTISSTSSSP